MYTLIRRSALPRLHLVPGAVACFHDDCITLLPVSTVQETVMTAEPLSSGGHGVILNVGGSALVVAQYPTRRLARRQLRRLAGDGGWGVAGWGGRGSVVAALLFLIWFLFFLPGDPSSSALALADPAPTARVAGHPSAPAADGPAFIDDPAVPAPVPNANGAGAEPVPAR